MTRAALVAAALTVLAVAGCGSASGTAPHHAGPPRPAALAARLGCHVTGTDPSQQTAYDTVQYVDASGGVCSNGGEGLAIITFASQAKETDWLHQNAAAENSSLPSGYFDVVSGRLWVIASAGAFGFPPSNITNKLGGKSTTF